MLLQVHLDDRHINELINEAAQKMGVSAAEFVRLAIREKLLSCGVKFDETVDKN